MNKNKDKEPETEAENESHGESEGEPDTDAEAETEKTTDNETTEENQEETDNKSEEKTEEEAANETENEAAAEGANGDDAKADEAEPKEPEPPKPVLKTFSKNLEFEEETHHVKVISDEEKENIYNQLKNLDEVEAAMKLLVESQNDLESFIYDKQDKLYLDGYTEYISEEKRDELSAIFSEASDWLWDVEDPTAVTYQDKLAELKKSTKEWNKRVEESQKRPEVIENLQKLFKATKTIIFEDFKNKTGEGLALSQDDIFGISEKLEKTEDWLSEEMEKQDDLPLYENPSLKAADVEIKGRVLSKAVDDLIKKVRLWRPPKPTEPPTTQKPDTDQEPEVTDEPEIIDEAEKTDEATDEAADEPEATAKPTSEPVTHDGAEL